jgi:hypothetical protein
MNATPRTTRETFGFPALLSRNDPDWGDEAAFQRETERIARDRANLNERFQGIAEVLPLEDPYSAIDTAYDMSVGDTYFYEPDWMASRDLWMNTLRLGFRLGQAFEQSQR